MSSILIACAHVVLAVIVSAHIVLTKDNVRAAIGWVGLVCLAPVVGAALYIVFGINRINRQVGQMRRRAPLNAADRAAMVRGTRGPAANTILPTDLPPSLPFPQTLHAVARVAGTITQLPLEAGCAIEPLVNGDEAYPAMLAAINAASQTVAMASYIFDRGKVGTEFVEALVRAVERGVQVRVLIDGIGARYSHPPIVGELRQRGVQVAKFLPPFFAIPHPYIDLRNHRKMMVVDGAIGFCGGMNVRDACVLALNLPGATQDLHFRIRGPVVRQIMRAFAFDWQFTTHEELPDAVWAPEGRPAGDLIARGIPDGPDADFETLLMVILGAVSQAKRSIRLATPYFLPDTSLIDAFRIAALRGVDVEILLPERGNLRLVQWAATAQLSQVLAWGCRVHLSPPPFDHTKLLVVDGAWSLVGSANLDPRSLRLNFEYNVECYSTTFAAQLEAILDKKIASARAVTLAELEGRSLLRQLRDGAAWLAQPYL